MMDPVNSSTTTDSPASIKQQHIHQHRHNQEKEKRPDRTTMEGMIWNAHHVLQQALDPKQKRVPKELFDKCIAVVLLSVVEGGFMFTGNVGTGIILKKKKNTKTTTAGTCEWSQPIACGLVGLGYGFIAGLSLKDILVFVMDEYTLDSLLSEHGFKLGGQAELTFGTLGRMAKLDFNAGKKAFGSTVSFAFSKGLFGGISIEGAVVGIRKECNEKFYGQKVSASQIISSEVSIPNHRMETMLLYEVYNKLNQLAAGGTSNESSGFGNDPNDYVVAEAEMESKTSTK